MTTTQSGDPIALFRTWFADAEQSEPNNPNAMTLATAAPGNAPSVRMLLLKGVDDRGFVFYTNMESRKAVELLANPQAAIGFHWKSLGRQIRIEGMTEQVSDDEADAYFASRPRGSQIGAWASKQSKPLETRFELEKRVALYTAKFHVGAVPRPDFWSGFRLIPARIEFWEERPFRLHDRLVYHCRDGDWTTAKLYP